MRYSAGPETLLGKRGKSLDSGSKYSILCAIYNLHLTRIRSSPRDSVQRPRRRVPVAAPEEPFPKEDPFPPEEPDP